jgi:hypothetical protein
MVFNSIFNNISAISLRLVLLVEETGEYKVRDLFKPGFEDLHLKFYQLERLMEVGLFVSSIC